MILKKSSLTAEEGEKPLLPAAANSHSKGGAPPPVDLLKYIQGIKNRVDAEHTAKYMPKLQQLQMRRLLCGRKKGSTDKTRERVTFNSIEDPWSTDPIYRQTMSLHKIQRWDHSVND